MLKDKMPNDLFGLYAASNPNDSKSSQTARVFSLLLCMREDNLEPDVDTYRAVMGLCTKEKLWHLSLLLLEHMQLNGIQPGKFIYNEICTVLEAENKYNLADIIYERSVKEGVFEPWNNDQKIDLHSFTANTARAAVRSVLTDMIRRPKDRPYHDIFNSNPSSLLIITGVGKRSEEGVAVIKPAILEMLNTEFGIPAMLQAHNPGCIEIFPQYLNKWVRQRIRDSDRMSDPEISRMMLELEPKSQIKDELLDERSDKAAFKKKIKVHKKTIGLSEP
mmetsp:Transcript_12169/g.18185  ORF Transcript_12169/g.18185 Transcript_12169/m.18185 type:complete len:276 (-) Transcript_12169:78-905(-)